MTPVRPMTPVDGVDPPVAPSGRVTAIVALAYVVLAWAFWGSFVLGRGLHAETGMIELSQERPVLDGFLYPADVDRVFMSLPFHLAYILSNGSYLSLHLLYGASIWLTGFLTFVLFRWVLPGRELLAFAIGAVALTHGADMSLMGVYMIMVREAALLVLVAILVFLIAWRRGRPGLMIAVAAAQTISLWTYEPGLPILLFAPFLIALDDAPVGRKLRWAVAFWAVPALKGVLLAVRYLVIGDVSYQSTRLQSGFSIWHAPLVLGRLAYDGLAFWSWPSDWLGPYSVGCTSDFLARAAGPVAIGVVGFLLAAFVITRIAPASSRDDVPVARLLLVVGIFLALAYVAFLPLSAARGWAIPGKMNWRTQFYAAVPSAALLVTALYVVGAKLRMRWAAIGVCGLIVGAGILAGIGGQLVENHRWAISRHVTAAIVRQAPRIKNDTFVILTNVPSRFSYSLCDDDPPSDPFGSPMWFNSNLQVLYPRTRLVGLYLRDDGRGRDRDFAFRFDAAGAQLIKSAIGLEGERFGYDQMVVFRFDRDRGAVLAREFPWRDIPGSVHTAAYRPSDRIDRHAAPVETLRKLGLIGRAYSAPRPSSFEPSAIRERVTLLDLDKSSLPLQTSANTYGLSVLWPTKPLVQRDGHWFYRTRSRRDHLATEFVPLKTPTTARTHVVINVWADDASTDEAAGEIAVQDDRYTILDRAGLYGLHPGEPLSLRVAVEPGVSAVRVIFFGIRFTDVMLPARVTIEEVKLE
jgi:hypothetical protein